MVTQRPATVCCSRTHWPIAGPISSWHWYYSSVTENQAVLKNWFWDGEIWLENIDVLRSGSNFGLRWIKIHEIGNLIQIAYRCILMMASLAWVGHSQLCGDACTLFLKLPRFECLAQKIDNELCSAWSFFFFIKILLILLLKHSLVDDFVGLARCWRCIAVNYASWLYTLWINLYI